MSLSLTVSSANLLDHQGLKRFNTVGNKILSILATQTIFIAADHLPLCHPLRRRL
jgi:hypothetical protein